MAPPCTGLKGFSAINRIIAPDAWHKSRLLPIPLGNLAGEIALHQLNQGRHFLVDNPRISELFELSAWTKVEQHPRL
eukprot:2773082-Prorocentrum_lima.AAC.1